MNLEPAERDGRLLAARAWIGLAVASLVIAGVFAVILVVGRISPFDRWFTDPLFFRRGLVVHVNLSLLIWFHAFATGLSTLLPARVTASRLPRLGVLVAAAGIVILCVAAAVPGAVPVLSNYVPAIDHPLFVLGMVLFGAGILTSLADGRLLVGRGLTRTIHEGAASHGRSRPRPAFSSLVSLRATAGVALSRLAPRALASNAITSWDCRREGCGLRRPGFQGPLLRGDQPLRPLHELSGLASPLPELVPAAAEPALRAAALATVLAALTFFGSAITTPAGLEPARRWELLAWGGGHVLIFASVASMLAIWLVLVGSVVGRAPLSRRAAAWLLAAYVAPLLGAPLLALSGAHGAFTLLMQLGSWPVPLIVMMSCARELLAARRAGRLAPGAWHDARILAFATSAGLTLVGFVLGGLIRGSSTVVPGHYHASIGAVTVALMGVTYVLLEPLGLRAPSPRARRVAAWQPVLFGVGQLTFAVGFALAGAHGMARKVYGVEQVRSGAETTGLAIMGVGGFVAVAGGLLYLGLVAAAWRAQAVARGADHPQPLIGSTPWTAPLAPSTPSRN